MSAIFPDLKGASTLITGGGSGIGAALTEGFAAQGAEVALIDLVDCAPLLDRIEAAHGARPLHLRADLRDVAAIEAAAAEARAAHGPIEKLICNAARDTRHRLGEVTAAQWDEMHAVNLRHLFFAAQACAEDLRAAGSRGAIVNFTSTSFMQGNGEMEVYMAGKSGVIGLTRGQARDLGGSGARANMLAPGWVMTERQRALWAGPEAMAQHLGLQCVAEELLPEDMVGPCLFLASDASRAMTGQMIVADRGRV